MKSNKLKAPGFYAGSSLSDGTGKSFVMKESFSPINGFEASATCYKQCCPSGDCDTTCCPNNNGAHVTCVNGKANTSCNDPITPGCFLTTACTAARGLPDDCEELTIMRNFRDSFLLTTEHGKELVKEYYSVAPLICAAIERESNSFEIYENLYNEILRTIEFIQKGEKSNAIEHYYNFTSRLKAKYFI